MYRHDERWTAQEIKTLRDGWHRGVNIKQLSHDCDRTIYAIKKKRAELKLPPRRKGNRKRQLKVSVSEDDYREMGKRAMERRQSISDYIRYLILRDIGRAT